MATSRQPKKQTVGAISQKNFILQYYQKRPGQSVQHKDAVDWATHQWHKQTGRVLRDPDRAIRNLCQDGILIKQSKGVYKYDPNCQQSTKVENFSPSVKRAILKKDDYRCVVCGRGEKNGIELHVDHIKPKDRGGRATLDNGQTLCGQHNYVKKNYDQLTFSKRLFLKMQQQANDNQDRRLQKFCQEILNLYNQYGVDDHIH